MKRSHVAKRMQKLERMLLSKRRVRSRMESLAIERQLSDLDTGHTRGLVWDEAEAILACEFIERLRHWKGEFSGKPMTLEDWQRELIVAPLFGWRREDGTRRFRFGYVEIPRKNGKTTLLAGIGLRGLMADDEPGAEIYAAATKHDQAAILFRDARNMLPKELRPHVKMFSNSIVCERLNATFRPIASDYHSLDGLNIHMALVDEVHAHRSSDLWDVLQTAMGARRQPLMIGITTAGYDRSSICWQQRSEVLRIFEKTKQNDAYFGFIACADDGDDWRDEATWKKANPNFGVSVKRDFLADACRLAIDSPSAENSFRRLHLNQWTEQAVRWMPIHLWDACQVDPAPNEPMIASGSRVYVGIDMASTRDLSSVVIVAPQKDDSYIVDPHYWCPAASVNSDVISDRQSYAGWANRFITVTEGNSIDQNAIREFLWSISTRYDIQCVAFDPWNMTEFYQCLVRDGWPNHEKTLFSFQQSYKNYNEPMKKLLDLVRDRKIMHDGNPVLRWNCGNVVAWEDVSGNIRPDKGKSPEKIDGFCAMLMGIGSHIQMERRGSSIYETEGLFTL